jgi:integrase
MPRVKLTEDSCAKALPGPRGQRVTYHDTVLPGFSLRVGSTSKTFCYQRAVDGTDCRATIGRWPAVTVAAARLEARRVALEMTKGVNPTAVRHAAIARQITLGQAAEQHAKRMRARGATSAEMLLAEIHRHLEPWLGRPLQRITKADVHARHQKLVQAAGPATANRVLRHFRACWNSAAKVLDDLPRCPVSAISWAREVKHRPVLHREQLPEWAATVRSIGNSVRADYHLFVLYTALRANDAATIRFEHVDWRARTLFRPAPKMQKPFTLPLSRQALAILEARREENPIIFGDTPWAFPTWDRKGRVTHLREQKESRDERDADGKKTGRKVLILPGTHTLRRTWASCAAELAIDLTAIRRLLNHTSAIEGDVTLASYLHPSSEYMQSAVQRVADALDAWMAGR